MRKNLYVCTMFTVLLLAGCAGGGSASAGNSNPMLDPEIKSLQSQGINSSITIFRSQGCKAPGFSESFSIAQKLENISQRYVGVIRGQYSGAYSDAEAHMASEALVDSTTVQIGLLKDIAKKAQDMGCKSIERKAYNAIIAHPVFTTGLSPIYSNDLMIARSNLSELGPR